jgi:meiotic recombination protein SPO11
MAQAQPSNPQPLEVDDGQDPSVQEYIDTTLMALVHELTLPPSEARLSVVLKRRANPTSCIINPLTGALEASPRFDASRTYSWPGKTAYEAWKFSMIFWRWVALPTTH